ncbi:MAG: trypsin-like peptidase domain-containing protein [Candidatus Roizmanbacteria bacterium]|nr:trypsin-like peptidase domain-containing protein [Candidatus Roizmanbacteria bacterium]
MKKLFFLILGLIVLIIVAKKINFLSNLSNTPTSPKLPIEKQTVVYEESVITKVVEEALPSVVTVGISTTTSTGDVFQINPFNPFLPFERIPGKTQKVEKNIGSGFIISTDGLIITNKHVVSNTEATYQVLTNDKKKYNVEKIYRDPLNDLSILKISLTSLSSLKPLKLGDSSKLKLGQLVIAIGTPLGEFTNTVTSGIISGLGRGITAGSPFEGFVEKLDNVIQTDAAISLGNSGGPLLNSKGEVIGVNAAIAQEGQNIGFAIPVNVVKNLIDNFKKQGSSFEHPYIGVRYKLVDKQTAVVNKLVEGAYVVQIISGSPAEKAGIQEEDIIIEFDGKKIGGSDEQTLTKFIAEKKPGERVTLKIWRNKEIKNISVTLESAK